MKTVVGIFKTRQAASEGVNLLKAAGFQGDKVIILTPDTPDPVVEKTVPTEDAEQPGMGKAIGSVVGGSGWSRRGSSHRQPSFTWDWSGLGGDVWSRGWRVGWRGSRSGGG